MRRAGAPRARARADRGEHFSRAAAARQSAGDDPEAGQERDLKTEHAADRAHRERRLRADSRTGESSEDAIAKLRELGVRIAIDDFGTGYSSLRYLKRWRVDYLKIDRSFVRDLVTDMGDLAIVGAIIAMARHLHIDVVAEGIEGWQQLEKLRQLGCPCAGVSLREAHTSRANAATCSAVGRFGLPDLESDLLLAASL